MKLAQNIHKIMKRGAQRSDLLLLKTNDAGYHTVEWQEVNKPHFI